MAGVIGEWLFDIGNTRLKFAPVVEGRVGPMQACAHDGAPTWIEALPPRFDVAWVASVAPAPVTGNVLDALTARCRRISVARTLQAMQGLRIAYAQPRQLGVDRFLALLAARARTPHAALVVGIGTALTIDLLDAHGRHRGGRIAPSPLLMREALHARAARLPAAGGNYIEFASSTADALASGCDGAALALVDASLSAATQMLGTAPGLWLHGGGADTLLASLPAAIHAPALVLEGLLHWGHPP